MRKLLIIFGLLIVLLVSAAFVIPMVVDVDQYRPKLVELVNQRLNGKLELGKLKLSLWGVIRVQVDGVQLFDSKKIEVVSVKEAYIHLPWISLFKGSPELVFKMNQPQLQIIREKSGVMNIATLIKVPQANGNDQTSDESKIIRKEESSSEKSTATQEIVLPAIAMRASLGLELNQAALKFTDRQEGNNVELKDLNVAIRNLSLNHPMELTLSTQIDTALKAGAKVQGPIQLKAKVSPQISDGKLSKVAATLTVTATDLSLQQPGVFQKNAGIVSVADIDLVYSDPILQINHAKLQFHNAVVSIKGQISEKTTQLDLESNEINLSEWKTLIPAVHENSIRGFFAFHAKTEGPNDKLDYSAELKLRDILLKNPMLKAEPKIGITVNVKTDQIESLLMQVTAPGNDLQIRGKIKSFARPQFDFQVNSKEMDLDRLLVFQESSERSASLSFVPKAYAAKKETIKKEKLHSTTDFDSMLDVFRNQPVLAQSSGLIEFNLANLTAKKVNFQTLKGRMSLNDGVVTLEKTSFKVFDGGVLMGAKIALKPKRPTYQFNANVLKLSMQKAIDSQLAMFKNTVYGDADFKIEGSGSSLNPDLAMKTLNAKGSFKLANSKFTSIDIAKMVNEGLEEALGKVTSKIPGFETKALKKLSSGATEYEVIASDFQLKESIFSMPNFIATSKPGKAVDLKGQTTVNLEKQTIQARWEVIDVHNITGAKDLSVNIGGKKIESILTEKGQPVRFPIHVSGPLSAPQASKAETIEYLLKIALKNTTSGFVSKAKEDVIKKVFKGVDPQGQGGTKDILKGGLKKLFR